MNMNSIKEIKEKFLTTFFNRQDIITKVSSVSVIDAIAYAVSNVLFKIKKDVEILFSKISLSSSYSSYLDEYANFNGFSQRKGATSSN